MSYLSLPEYVDVVRELIDRASSIEDLVTAIAQQKQELLKNPELLPADIVLTPGANGYARNLLHSDADGQFVVMALVWSPTARTPVHDHETWGVVGSYRGDLGVMEYEKNADGPGLGESCEATLTEGTIVSLTPPRHSNIHQMCNSSADRAVSIHTYGDAGTVCRVYNRTTGETKDNQLKFSNQP